MSKRFNLVRLIFELSNERDTARKLKETKPQTNRYTVLSIIYSILACGLLVLAGYLINLVGVDSVELVKKIIYIFVIIICAILSLTFYLHSLNFVSCQRIVNKSKSRYLALLINLIAFVGGILFVILFGLKINIF